MTRLYHITYKLLIIFLISFLSSCAPRYIEEREPPVSDIDDPITYLTVFQNKLTQIINRPEFTHTIPSIFIMSADSGDILFSHMSELLLRPASNQKILTSAAALHHLGINYNFRTILYRNGPIENGILNGDLILKGYGDPLLTHSHLQDIVDGLSLFGIRKIEGDIIIDETFFDEKPWPSGWMWDDEPHAYVPFLSPLSINKNIVTFTIEKTPNDPTGYRISIEPQSSAIEYELVFSDDEDSKNTLARISPDRSRNNNSYTIFINPNASSFYQRISVTVRDPAVYAVDLFTRYLLEKGLITTVKIKRGSTDTTSIPMIQINTPLIQILEEMDKYSDNLSAELLLKTLGAVVYGIPGTGTKGSQTVKEALLELGINAYDFRIVDGSGVSFYNLVSAQGIGEILYALYHHNNPEFYTVFNRSLSVMGVDGTLSSRLRWKPVQGKIRGRTGTLTGISSLSGYAETSNGETLIFVMIFQNFSGPAARYRQIQDEICTLLIQFNRSAYHVVTP